MRNRVFGAVLAAAWALGVRKSLLERCTHWLTSQNIMSFACSQPIDFGGFSLCV